MEDFSKQYNIDKTVWDNCADIYEQRIVSGHPDIKAFEEFEEEFLDKLIKYLADEQDKNIKLMDIGCGSGRLHIRYGLKSINEQKTDSEDVKKVKDKYPELKYDAAISNRLKEVWGIDFSEKMLNLAKSKSEDIGIDKYSDVEMSFEHGSAFDLEALDEEVFPVVVCLVNSIGVMQGREGAQKLFSSMKKLTEKTGGVAIISCYLQEFVESYALNQYESTLDVSGQPKWLGPKDYAEGNYKLVSKHYKRAHDTNPNLTVDVYGKNGSLIKENFTLKRIPGFTRAVVCSGNIQTHTDYESHWYNYFVIDQWIKKYWGEKSHHIKTKVLDGKRAEPAQLAIYDPQDLLKYFIKNYNK